MKTSKYPRWFNPTESALWDEYYEIMWVVLGAPALILLTIFSAAVGSTITG